MVIADRQGSLLADSRDSQIWTKIPLFAVDLFLNAWRSTSRSNWTRLFVTDTVVKKRISLQRLSNKEHFTPELIFTLSNSYLHTSPFLTSADLPHQSCQTTPLYLPISLLIRFLKLPRFTLRFIVLLVSSIRSSSTRIYVKNRHRGSLSSSAISVSFSLVLICFWWAFLSQFSHSYFKRLYNLLEQDLLKFTPVRSSSSWVCNGRQEMQNQNNCWAIAFTIKETRRLALSKRSLNNEDSSGAHTSSPLDQPHHF